MSQDRSGAKYHRTQGATFSSTATRVDGTSPEDRSHPSSFRRRPESSEHPVRCNPVLTYLPTVTVSVSVSVPALPAG